jgi:hypothetical protein
MGGIIYVLIVKNRPPGGMRKRIHYHHKHTEAYHDKSKYSFYIHSPTTVILLNVNIFQVTSEAHHKILIFTIAVGREVL